MCACGNSCKTPRRSPHNLSPLQDYELIGTLDRERRESTALEFTVIGAQTRILATSSDRPMDACRCPRPTK